MFLYFEKIVKNVHI